MTHKNHMTALLLWSGLFLVPLAFAQAEAEKTNPGSQEVEYNDDNYRRFMELKDQPVQRSSVPTNAYQPGPQKLDNLPEASQKHLRNQLREIILEGGEWAPGDENNEYPYVASEAAQENPTLQQQEAEAWGELVGKYHQREAQIYANSSSSKSAAGVEGGAQDASQAQAKSTGESAVSDGSNSGESGTGDAQKQSSQEQKSAHASNQDSYSPASSANPDDPKAESTAGVSQSALEYLMSKSKTANSSQVNTPTGTPAMPDSGIESPSQQQNPQQQDATPEPGQLVVISKDTLSIKDLQKAQGITISTGTGSSQATPIDIEDDNEGGLRKDEDG